MTNKQITRRHYLAATGASALVLGLGADQASAQMATIRQGYQTNIWGMPTYYLMKSGALEKRGLKFQEFAVAVRQSHHAADGRPPGRPRHLCRAVVPDRPRQAAAWSRSR